MAFVGSNYLHFLGTLFKHFYYHFSAQEKKEPNPQGGFFWFVYLPYMGRTNLCDIGKDRMICLFHILGLGHQKPVAIPGGPHHIRRYGPVKGALTSLYQDLL